MLQLRDTLWRPHEVEDRADCFRSLVRDQQRDTQHCDRRNSDPEQGHRIEEKCAKGGADQHRGERKCQHGQAFCPELSVTFAIKGFFEEVRQGAPP